MKAQKSPLEIIDFAIISSNISYINSSNQKKEIKTKDTNFVDIDFDILRSSNKTDFKIILKIKINENGTEGYGINVTAIGIFSIKTITDEKEIASLINYSALSICIGNVRSFIANTTSYYPNGKYLFHSIDMNELFKEKTKSVKKLIKTPKTND